MDGTAQQVLALQRQYAASVIDAAAKQAFHSKRSALTVADLPVKAYGHGGASGPAQLLHVPEADGLLVRADAQLDTAELPPLPKAPMETSVQPHWLAIDGMQPATAENAQPRRVGTSRPPSAGAGGAAAGPAPRAAGGAAQPAAAPAAAAGAQQGGGEPGGIVAGLPLRHSLPDELQLYYDMVRRALQSKGGAPLAGRAVAASLATDPGLQPVLPYLVPLLAQEVANNLADTQQLRLVLSAIRGLLSNAHLQLVPYIHHLLPAILTCLVARKMGTAWDHWAIRDKAAALLAQMARRSQERNDELAAALARAQQSLAAALFDEAPETQYGSLMGLTAFGVPVLLSLVVPNLQRFSDMLEEAPLTLATLQVRSALVVAVGRCMRWNGGREAARIRQLVRGTCLQDAAVAVDPLAVENKLTPKSRRSRPASRLPWHCLL